MNIMQHIKRLAAALIALCLTLCLCPAPVMADGGTIEVDIQYGKVEILGNSITYYNNALEKTTAVISADTKLIITGTTTTQNTVSVNNNEMGPSVYDITLKDVNIDVSDDNRAAFQIAPNTNVALTLEGTNTLKSGSNNAGLDVPSGAEVTIKASTTSDTHSLEAQGSSSGEGAGIGGKGSQNAGIINIQGGDITATGGAGGTGIGGGSGGGGTINISGGNITATGYSGSAGIGSGSGSGNSTINISGGNINATGSGVGISGGAGIGGGKDGGGSTINISGGTIVNAQGSGGGAGIGGGACHGNSVTVNISGGTIVNAQGSGGGADIGMGDKGFEYGNSVMISGGNVNAASNKITFRPIAFHTPVYRVELTLEDDIGAVVADKPVKSFLNQPSGHTYGLNDVKTLADGKLYFYLPQNSTLTSLITKNPTDGTGDVIYIPESSEPFSVTANNLNECTLKQGGAPVITAPIDNVTVSAVEGGTATLSVSANNATTYQWYKYDTTAGGAVPIPDATEASYIIEALTLANNGEEYYCSAMNAAASADSPVFTLNVTEAPPAAPGLTPITIGPSRPEDSGYTGTPLASASVYNESGSIWLTGVELDSSDMLITEPLTQGDDYDTMFSLAHGNTVINAYNIYLKSGKTLTGSAMYLNFSMGASRAGQKFTLAHKKTDGTIEYFHATVNANGLLSFGPLYELSPFMLFEGELAPSLPTPQAPPQTGDDTALWPGIAMLAAAGLIVLARVKSKRQE